MKIALIGYGKMGKIIEQVAIQREHTIVARIDPSAQDATAATISSESIADAEICIDFSHPLGVLENMRKVSALGKPVVVGTTGWSAHLGEARSIVMESKIGFLHASNFSIGMNVMFRVLESASKLMNKFPEYDVAGYELHHSKKLDSPSGTAKSLIDILLKNIERKQTVVSDKVDGEIQPQALHFASVRAGNIPGTHTILFDSAADTIEITHTARNREGFALGAVIAAEWLINKKGFFTIDDVMNDLMSQ
ncbi:MAG: 4-hydroxy-tetrahydrodipicolinate reductase [Nanoarchaeota archaeon]|mgnify:CR=1 FL=1